MTKLRTQRRDWPRDPRKRLQDRANLMALLQTHPEIADAVRHDPLTNDEMRRILDDVLGDLARPGSDELPPEDDADDRS